MARATAGLPDRGMGRRLLGRGGRTLLDAAFGGLALLPPAPLDRVLGWVGRLHAGCYPGEAAYIAATLACPRPVAARIAGRARANLHRARVDMLRCVGRVDARGCVRLVGEERLRAAYARGNGVILATVHTTAMWPGLWSALSLAPRRGYRIHGVGGTAVPASAREIEEFAYTVRGADRRSLTRAPLDALLSGAVLVLPVDVLAGYGDVRPRERQVATRFLGSRAVFSTGAATLARLARAPIVPVVAVRTGPARYEVRFLAPVEPPAERAGDRATMDAVLASLQAALRAHPDQYCWWLLAWAWSARDARGSVRPSEG